MPGFTKSKFSWLLPISKRTLCGSRFLQTKNSSLAPNLGRRRGATQHTQQPFPALPGYTSEPVPGDQMKVGAHRQLIMEAAQRTMVEVVTTGTLRITYDSYKPPHATKTICKRTNERRIITGRVQGAGTLP